MTNSELKYFINDVLNLYCKIKVGAVEDVFIKLSNVEINSFWKWLLKNNRIRPSLMNSSVYDALDLLSHLRSMYSYGQTLNNGVIIRTLHENAKSLKTIPVIITMQGIIDNNETKDILQPYRDIIGAIRERFPSAEPLDEADIISDIYTIKSLYFKNDIGEEKAPVRETISQKRINMFKYLLSKFSDSISNAADSSDMPELASAIRSGILAKLINEGLNKYMDFGKLDLPMVDFCKKTAEYVLKNPHYEKQWGEHNYGLIEMVFMNASGNLTKEEMMNIKSEYERNYNPISALENREEVMHPGFNLDRIQIDKRINPKYLFLVSTFFVILRAKAGLPTGFMADVTY